jgi:hypothetical protein
MLKKILIIAISMLAISSNSMAASIHEEISSTSIDKKISKSMLKQTEEFREWVDIVEKDNPELLCPTTSSNNFVCNYLSELRIYKEDNVVSYTSYVKSHNSSFVALPSFRKSIPDMVLFDGEEVPFFIERVGNRNIPYIKPLSSEGVVEVVFSQLENNLWLNNNLDTVYFDDVKHQASDNVFFMGQKIEKQEQEAEKEIEYTIFNAIKYSEAPVFERHIVVETNNNKGIFEIPVEIPNQFDVFNVESMFSYEPVIYENGNLKFNLKDRKNTRLQFKISSRLSASESNKDIEFSIEGLEGQLIAFKNQGLTSANIYASIDEENRINENRNTVKRMIPNIPDDILRQVDYSLFISSDNTIEIEALERNVENLPQNNNTNPNLSNINTTYIAGNEGKTIVETTARANGGAYNIASSNFSNITAKLNGEFIPVAKKEGGGYNIVVENGGQLSVSGETKMEGSMFITSYNLPKSIIETSNTVDNVKVYASGLHTPLNKIGADNGLPYEVIIILVFISILLYMFTKNVLVSAFYLIASYISLGYVTIATLSFMLTNSIIIGLVIVGVYLVRKGSSEKYVKVGRIITSVIITIGLMIGLAGNISYSLSNKIEQHVRATNYSSPQALRSSGKVMSESVSSDFMAASPVENKISITSWKNPVGVSLNHPTGNKFPSYTHTDVSDDNVSKSFISAYWLATIAWLLSTILFVANAYKNTFRKKGVKNENK